MAVNKVVYDGETLIDLTSDTVTAENLEEGVTAHSAGGEQITGTGLPGRVRYDQAQTLTDTQKAQARANIGVTAGGKPVTATWVNDELTTPIKSHFNIDLENVTELYDGLEVVVTFPSTSTVLSAQLYLSINGGDSYVIFKQPFHGASGVSLVMGELYYLGYTTRLTLAVNHNIPIYSTPVWYATDIANTAIIPAYLSSAVPVNKGGTGATTAAGALKNLGGASKDYAHPVGSVLITSTNTDPGDTLGGTWELVEKQFSEVYFTDTSNLKTYFTPGTGTLSYKLYGFRSGHTIDVKLSFTGTGDFTDDTAEIGTLVWSQWGADSRILYGVTCELATSDAGGGAVMCSVAYDTGAVTARDIIPNKSTVTALPGEYEYTLRTQLICNTDNMLDAACDKFYWKRTA